MDLLTALALAIGINILMFIPAFIFKTDKLTDISYALTFAVLGVCGFIVSQQSMLQLILLLMILLWATRLGCYLLVRIRKMGRDKRFDDKRNSLLRFGGFWMLQGLTVWVVMIPSVWFFAALEQPMNVVTIIGFVVWAVGITIEGIADLQKYRFINNPAHNGQWIATGLWKYSRHPNYFGEILLWAGVYLFVVSALSTVQSIVALVSPIYIGSLIILVSGIPLLEKSADKRWGSVQAYQQYKKKTSILIPWFIAKEKYNAKS